MIVFYRTVGKVGEVREFGECCWKTFSSKRLVTYCWFWVL